ncbi:MAG TPA: hypothetical protein VLJ19_03100 [Variovorax sp.]|nr:hypothetical protein [Variovorax sp.]
MCSLMQGLHWTARPALAVALLCLAPLVQAGDDSQRLSTMSESELEAGMRSGVQVVLQRVPIQMEDQSILVGAEYEPNTRVATYHYVQPRAVDPQALRIQLTAKNCATPNTRAMLSRGISFRHLYTAGKRLYDVTVTSNDCGNARS